MRRRKKKKKARQAGRQAIVKVPPCCSILNPVCLQFRMQARGGDHWVSPPPPARPLRCACAYVNLLFYPHVTFQPLLPALPPSPKSLINKFACFLYPHTCGASEARRASALLLVFLFFLSPSLSIRARIIIFLLIFFPTLLATAMATVTCLAKSLRRRKGAQRSAGRCPV